MTVSSQSVSALFLMRVVKCAWVMSYLGGCQLSGVGRRWISFKSMRLFVPSAQSSSNFIYLVSHHTYKTGEKGLILE